MKLALHKSHLAMGLLVLALVPWYSGGREPGGLFISLAALALAGYLVWRSEDLPRLQWGIVPLSFTALGMWSAVSLVWSVNRYETLQWCILLVAAAAAFTLARVILQDNVRREGWVRGYVALASATALYGMYDFLRYTSFDRLTSWFGWPNAAAIFVLPAILIGCSWLNGTVSRRRQVLAGLVILVNGLAFWLTASRGATLALLAVGVAAIVQNRRAWRWLLACAVLLTVAFGLAQGTMWLRGHVLHGAHSASVVSRSVSTSSATESYTISDRTHFLRSAAEMWRHRPLLGYGAGTYGTMHPQYQFRVTDASSQAHNAYLQLFAELGAVGGMLGVILGAGLLWQAWTTWRRHPALGAFAAGLAVLVLHFGVDMDTAYATLVLLAAIITGITYTEPRSGWGTLPAGGAVLSVVVVAALALAYPPYYNAAQAAGAARDQADADYVRAAASYDRATSGLWPDPSYYVSSGINYYTLARYYVQRPVNLRLASQRAAAAIAADPQDAAAYFLQGLVLEDQGKPQAAISSFKQALNKDPYSHPEYYGALADLYVKQGARGKAQVLLRAALKQYDAPTVANRSFVPGFAASVAQLHKLARQVGE